jgi:hypothetical protein
MMKKKVLLLLSLLLPWLLAPAMFALAVAAVRAWNTDSLITALVFVGTLAPSSLTFNGVFLSTCWSFSPRRNLKPIFCVLIAPLLLSLCSSAFGCLDRSSTKLLQGCDSGACVCSIFRCCNYCHDLRDLRRHFASCHQCRIGSGFRFCSCYFDSYILEDDSE